MTQINLCYTCLDAEVLEKLVFWPLRAPAVLVSLVLDADDAARRPANLIFLNGSSLTTCIEDGGFIESVVAVVPLVWDISLIELNLEWDDKFWSNLSISSLGDGWLVFLSIAVPSSLAENTGLLPPTTVEGVKDVKPSVLFPSVSAFWCKLSASDFLGSCFWDSSEILSKLVDPFLVSLGSVPSWGEVFGSAVAGALSGGNVGVSGECGCSGLVFVTSLGLVFFSSTRSLSLGICSLLEWCEDMDMVSEIASLVMSLLFIFSTVIGGFNLKLTIFTSNHKKILDIVVLKKREIKNYP